VSLTQAEQKRLLDHAILRLSAVTPLDVERFRRGFAHCSLARNLQILGAFGFLSTVKGKPGFARYIPAALQSLDTQLAGFGHGGFTKLRRVVADVRKKLGFQGE
jgi:aminoglycoside/choline kinase family phosphotransferase